MKMQVLIFLMELAKEQKSQKITLILIYILSVDLIITLVAKFNGLFLS